MRSSRRQPLAYTCLDLPSRLHSKIAWRVFASSATRLHLPIRVAFSIVFSILEVAMITHTHIIIQKYICKKNRKRLLYNTLRCHNPHACLYLRFFSCITRWWSLATEWCMGSVALHAWSSSRSAYKLARTGLFVLCKPSSCFFRPAFINARRALKERYQETEIRKEHFLCVHPLKMSWAWASGWYIPSCPQRVV